MMTLQDWVARLKAGYPHLPDHLTIDVEKDRLSRLSGWFQRVDRLRGYYDRMDRSRLDSKLRQAGKRQIVPVLMSLETMTEEEIEAWHELFVCLSAMMAGVAADYYKSHVQGKSAALTLEDVLNYLPVVFLFVLSSYDADRRSDSHSGSFSREGGRTRLITWIFLDVRRHINAYMQHHAYTVKRGSGTAHRLKSKILKIHQAFYNEYGQLPEREETLMLLSEEEDRIVTIDQDMYNAILGDEALSLDARCADDSDVTFADMLPAEAPDVEGLFEPVGFAMRMAQGNSALEKALIKLFTSEEPLTTAERFSIGV